MKKSNSDEQIVEYRPRSFGQTALQHAQFNEECAKGTTIELHSKDWVAMSRTQYDNILKHRPNLQQVLDVIGQYPQYHPNSTIADILAEQRKRAKELYGLQPNS